MVKSVGLEGMFIDVCSCGAACASRLRLDGQLKYVLPFFPSHRTLANRGRRFRLLPKQERRNSPCAA